MLRGYKEKKDGFSRLEDKFVSGRNKIKAMISC